MHAYSSHSESMPKDKDVGRAGLLRTPQACQICRRRKTKCNGQRPHCSYCSKNNIECVWPDASSSGGYHVGSPNVQMVSLSPTTSQGSGRIVEPPQATSDPQAIPTPQRVADEDLDSTLPSSTCLQRLIDIFFDKHHKVEFCSFLRRSSFDPHEIHLRPVFLQVSIITLASLYLDDDDVQRNFGFASAQVLSDHYAARARKLARDLSDEPTISSCQANLILGHYELLTRKGLRAWMYVGVAIRMSLGLRLAKEYSPNHTPQEKEIRRRTHWACLIMDRLLAYCSARPQTLRLEKTEIQLPCPETSFIFNEPYIGPSLDEFVNNRITAPLTYGVLPYFVTAVALWGNMACLYVAGRRQVILPPAHPSSPFSIAIDQLRQWCQRLPEKYRWSMRNYSLHRSVGEGAIFFNMSILLQHALCVSHQEYLPHLEMPRTFAQETPYPKSIYDTAGLPLDHRDENLIAVCVQSANNIIEMAKAMLEQHTSGILLQSTFIGGALMTAATIFLWVQYAAKGYLDRNQHAANAKDKVKFVLELYLLWGTRQTIAGAWADTLCMLSKLYATAYGNGGAETSYDEGSIYPGANLPSSSEGLTDTTVIKDAMVGVPEPDKVCQTMFDKVRLITLTPFEDVENKQKELEVIIRTLWQHMWIYDAPNEMNGVMSLFL